MGVEPELTTYVGLLRAVNVGGSPPIGMSALKEILESRGLHDVHTLLQSGNVVFKTKAAGSVWLERDLQGSIRARLGVTTEVFLRTAKEWRTLLEGNPFRSESVSDPGHVVLAALKSTPAPEDWSALITAIRGREMVEPSGRNAYVVFPDGIGRSKLTLGLLERMLKTRCTLRNWNTVRKLDQLASG